MPVLEDLKILLPTATDPILNLYIRKATTLISLYLNVPIITIPDKYTFNPLQPLKTTVYPNMATTTKTDDGINTIIAPTNIATTYPDAIIEYVILCFNKRGNEGIKQFSQGSRSGTYDDNLPQSIKALLPIPYVTMTGVRRC